MSKAWRLQKLRGTHGRQLLDRPIVDGEIDFLVEPRRVDDPIGDLGMIVEGARSSPRERLPASARDVAGNAHADLSVSPQIHDVQGRYNLDFCVSPPSKLDLLNVVISVQILTLLAGRP